MCVFVLGKRVKRKTFQIFAKGIIIYKPLLYIRIQYGIIHTHQYHHICHATKTTFNNNNSGMRSGSTFPSLLSVIIKLRSYRSDSDVNVAEEISIHRIALPLLFFCSFEEKPYIVNGFLYAGGLLCRMECQIIIVVGDGDASTIIKSDLPYAQLCLMVIKRLCHEIFTKNVSL